MKDCEKVMEILSKMFREGDEFVVSQFEEIQDQIAAYLQVIEDEI